MPIVQVPYGSAKLLAQSDYQKINNLLAMGFMNVNQPHWEDDANNIVQGAVFQIGGTVYYANAATAIGGAPSDYIKLTPSGDGLTVAPTYVANLAGVTWNSAYNTYDDVGGNAYIFDELVAIDAGEIAAANTRLWKAFTTLLAGNFTFTGDPTFSGYPSFSHGVKVNGSFLLTNPTQNTIFDALDAFIPTIGDEMQVNGRASYITGSTGTYTYTYTKAVRDTETRIFLYNHEMRMVFDAAGALTLALGVNGAYAVTNGDATVNVDVISLSW